MSPAITISEKLANRLGLIPHPRFVPSLERAEPRFVERYGVGLAELVDRMDVDREVFHDLAGALSVGETYFLRHDAHFDRICTLVQERLTANLPGDPIVIWSAGCSSGEEPYSVALALLERFGEAVLDRIAIYATDVDPRAIARAERAEYTPWSFRGAPAWLDERYFRRATGENRTLVHPRIRRAVSFDCATLEARSRTFTTASVDLVLFRNVSIYLTDAAREALHVEMRRLLRPSGLLVQGPSDPAPRTTEFVREPGDVTFCCHVPARADGSIPRATSLPRASEPRPTRAPAPARRPVARRPMGSPRPPSIAPALAPIAIAAEPTLADRESVLSLAERGELDVALRTVTSFTLAPVARAVLLGKLHLAARDPVAAGEHLRRAVFLAADDPMARYWYAQALELAGDPAGARRQLVELARKLERIAPDVRFEDGEFRADELGSSVSFFLERLR